MAEQTGPGNSETPAEKVPARTTAENWGERAKRGERGRFERALGKVADTEPEERDRL